MKDQILPISAVIPARNEEKTLPQLLGKISQSTIIDEVVVVDNGSTDHTAEVARDHGALVVSVEKEGFGRALKAGFKRARNPWIFKIDADIVNFENEWVERFVQETSEDTILVKGYWPTDSWPRPVTTLVAKPILAIKLPELTYIHLPIAGIYLVRNILAVDDFGDGWEFDIQVLVESFLSGKAIHQAKLPEILDNRYPLPRYASMAEDILRFMLSVDSAQVDSPKPERVGQRKPKKIMLVMAHPDDAEIWCGGTIAKHHAAGDRLLLVIVTSDVVRELEARRIKNQLPNISLEFLNLSEFDSERIKSKETIGKVAEIIRDFEPEILITHHPADHHSDHRDCHTLATSALLRLQRSWVPGQLLLGNGYHQMLEDGTCFQPNLYVDTLDYSDLKTEIIANHSSQDVKYWQTMTDAMDRLNGLKSRSVRAEAFQASTYYICAKAANLL